MSVLNLRDYQERSKTLALDAINAGNHPVIALPTGSGKSLVLAAICEEYARLGKRVLVATHRRELLVQDAAALASLAPEVEQGIYSAGLNRRDTHQRIIFGGIQSCYERMPELQRVGLFDLVLVDECHLVPRDAETMYGALFAAAPAAARCGLSATPYRLDSGLLYEGTGAMFDVLACHIEPKTLIPDFLAPLVGRGTESVIDTEGVRSARGDFVTKELEQAALDDRLIRETVLEAKQLAGDRQHWLVFCVTVAHAEAVAAELRYQQIDAALVTGETHKGERDHRIAAYKKGDLTALVSVGVLTTGFDAPHTDLIICLRPTQSKSLHEQILGRGMRKHPDKRNCLVLDFAGNIARHGAIGMLTAYAPSQREKNNAERLKKAADAQTRVIVHATRAAMGDPMGDAGDVRELLVRDVKYSLQPAKKYEGKTNLVVEYACLDTETHDERCLTRIRQYVCLEYPGGAGWHAKNWFRRRGVLNPPVTAKAARSMSSALPVPSGLRVVNNSGFWNVQIERWTDDAPETEVFA